jgi:hypothetical protein
MKKTEGQKSRETVPLSINYEVHLSGLEDHVRVQRTSISFPKKRAELLLKPVSNFTFKTGGSNGDTIIMYKFVSYKVCIAKM